MLRDLIKTARPIQWAKNGLVFAAPLSAGVLDEGDALADTIAAFFAFCAMASATYFFNDLLDAEADREHPRKRDRPIAAGRVSVTVAVSAIVVLVAVAMGLTAVIGRSEFLVTILIYAALTATYSLVMKHLVILDLMAVAGGFVVRAVAGAAAVDVEASIWFLLTTSFASLFVVIGKRFHEVTTLDEGAAAHRKILAEYPLPFLRTLLATMLGATIVSYCLWAFETGEVQSLDFPVFELSIVPVVASLLRYQLLLETGHGGAPEDVFAHDRTMQLLGLAWAVMFVLGIYI